MNSSISVWFLPKWVNPISELLRISAGLTFEGLDSNAGSTCINRWRLYLDDIKYSIIYWEQIRHCLTIYRLYTVKIVRIGLNFYLTRIDWTCTHYTGPNYADFRRVNPHSCWPTHTQRHSMATPVRSTYLLIRGFDCGTFDNCWFPTRKHVEKMIEKAGNEANSLHNITFFLYFLMMFHI